MQNKEGEHYKIARRNSTNSLESLEVVDEIEKEIKKMKKRNRMSCKIDPEMMKELRRKSGTAVPMKVVKSRDHQKKVINQVKVYSISNISSRERLRQKIEENKKNKPIIINWNEILSCKE